MLFVIGLLLIICGFYIWILKSNTSYDNFYNYKQDSYDDTFRRGSSNHYSSSTNITDHSLNLPKTKKAFKTVAPSELPSLIHNDKKFIEQPFEKSLKLLLELHTSNKKDGNIKKIDLVRDSIEFPFKELTSEEKWLFNLISSTLCGDTFAKKQLKEEFEKLKKIEKK